MAIEIVDFPIKHGGSFHGKMLVHQRVWIGLREHLHRKPWVFPSFRSWGFPPEQIPAIHWRWWIWMFNNRNGMMIPNGSMTDSMTKKTWHFFLFEKGWNHQSLAKPWTSEKDAHWGCADFHLWPQQRSSGQLCPGRPRKFRRFDNARDVRSSRYLKVYDDMRTQMTTWEPSWFCFN